MSEPCITLSDLKAAANYCHGGARVWFKQHNIPWSNLLAGKVTIKQIEAQNDPLGNRVVAYAKARQRKL